MDFMKISHHEKFQFGGQNYPWNQGNSGPCKNGFHVYISVSVHWIYALHVITSKKLRFRSKNSYKMNVCSAPYNVRHPKGSDAASRRAVDQSAPDWPQLKGLFIPLNYTYSTTFSLHWTDKVQDHSHSKLLNIPQFNLLVFVLKRAVDGHRFWEVFGLVGPL